MKVKLRTFARFREVFGGDTDIELPEGAALGDLFDILRSGPEEQRDCLFRDDGCLKGYVIVMKNRQRLKKDEMGSVRLSEGDEIALYPPVAGG